MGLDSTRVKQAERGEDEVTQEHSRNGLSQRQGLDPVASSNDGDVPGPQSHTHAFLRARFLSEIERLRRAYDGTLTITGMDTIPSLHHMITKVLPDLARQVMPSHPQKHFKAAAINRSLSFVYFAQTKESISFLAQSDVVDGTAGPD